MIYANPKGHAEYNIIIYICAKGFSISLLFYQDIMFQKHHL